MADMPDPMGATDAKSETSTNCTKRQTSKSKNKPTWVEIGTLLVLIATFVASAFAVREALRLADLTEQTLSEIHAANIASDRARVGPIGAGIIGDLKEGNPIKVGIQYINTGREAAPTVVWGDAKLFTTDEWRDGAQGSAARQNINFQDQCISGQFSGSGIASNVTYPTSGSSGFNANFDSSHEMSPPFVADADAISGRRIFVIRVCFTYHTQGEIHHSAACYFYRGGFTNPRSLHYCLQGQAAD